MKWCNRFNIEIAFSCELLLHFRLAAQTLARWDVQLSRHWQLSIHAQPSISHHPIIYILVSIIFDLLSFIWHVFLLYPIFYLPSSSIFDPLSSISYAYLIISIFYLLSSTLGWLGLAGLAGLEHFVSNVIKKCNISGSALESISRGVLLLSVRTSK